MTVLLESGEDAIAERLREIRAEPEERLRYREAVQMLGALMPALPDADWRLFEQETIDALQIVRDIDPKMFGIYASTIGKRCGRVWGEAVLQNIRPPRTTGQEIRMLSPRELIARPAPIDRIQSVLPCLGTAAIIGESGSGKSFAAQDMLFAIGQGDPWHGRRTRYAPSVIVQAEGSAALRMKAQIKHRNLNLDDVPIRIVEQALDLRTPGADVDRLLQAIEAVRSDIGAVRVVLIDTLARSFGAGNESAGDDMGQFIANVDKVAKAIDGLVIVIHHTGKDSAKGARGHSSFRAALDAEIEVTRSANGIRTAKVTKSRDGEDGGEFSFRLESLDLGPHPDPEAGPGARLTSCVCVPCEAAAPARHMPKGRNQASAYNAISGAIAGGQTLLEAEAVRLVQTACQMQRPRAWEAVRGLLAGGFIVKGPMGPIELTQ